jgi:hypothetical protein
MKMMIVWAVANNKVAQYAKGQEAEGDPDVAAELAIQQAPQSQRWR